jgi:hypothetical protein
MAEPRRYRVESYDAFEMYDEDVAFACEGEFATAEEALACARGVIARSLAHLAAQSRDDLVQTYWSFGDIPVIHGEPRLEFDVGACVTEWIATRMPGSAGA